MMLSGLHEAIGVCEGDVPRLSAATNRGQEILLNTKEAGEEGWIGGWAEMVFSVNRKHPFITCPRGVARLEAIDVCSRPVPLRNQFYEYTLFGNGRMPHEQRWESAKRWGLIQAATRNYSPMFSDIDPPPQQIQIFAVNPADTVPNPQTGVTPPRVLVQGYDQNGNKVWTQDGGNTVEGEFVTLAAPYALTVNSYSAITGIQKDVTQGEVQLYQSDPIWGTAEMVSVMEPTETTGWYRRYYINGLPNNCCPSFRPIRVNPGAPTCGCPNERKEFVQVTALAKLDLIPVVAPTDYLLIQSVEAVIRAAQSARFSNMDSEGAIAKEAQHRKAALDVLRGQALHREGRANIAVRFSPFGSANLRRQKIGALK